MMTAPGIGRAVPKVGADDYIASGATEADLQALQHIGLRAPLEVPDEAMIGVGREFADLFASHLESPRSFFYFAFLTYFGAAIAKMVTLDSELRPPPRLYTVLLGESADTRKSTALKKTDDFFRSLGDEWAPRVLFGAGSAEGIAAEMEAERSTLVLYFDELKGFIDKAKREGSALMPMVTSLFDSEHYDNRLKDRKIAVRGACLSLVTACTKDTYATLFDTQFIAIGFINRLWLVADQTAERIAIPRPIPPLNLESLRARVLKLLEAIKARFNEAKGQVTGRIALPLTPQARSMFEAWYADRPTSVFGKRLDAYSMRLMILLATSAGKSEVDVPVMEAVLSLARYQLTARQENDPVDADSAVARMEERIRRVLSSGPLRLKALKRAVHYSRHGLWIFQTALDNLARAKEVLHDRKTDSYRGAPESAPA